MKTLMLTLFLTMLMVLSLAAQESEPKNLYSHNPSEEIAENHALTEDSVTLESDNAESPENEGGLFTETTVETKSFGFEYFPLKMNVIYNYDSNAGDTEAEVNEENEELVLTYDAGSITYEQQFFKGVDGIYLTRTETSAFLFFGSKVTYPEPVLRLPLPLEVGKTWEWEGLETAGGDTGKLTIKGEALGEEVIETPMGKINCLKVTMRVESEIGSRNTVTEWLAPGIGVVKFHADLEGSGITGFLQSLMGLDEITFDLIGFEEEDKT